MNNKGITLIALVITIIVMLILAGVAVMAITGTGLFGQAESGALEARAYQADMLASQWRTNTELGWETRSRTEMIDYMLEQEMLTPEEAERLRNNELWVEPIGLTRNIHFIIGEPPTTVARETGPVIEKPEQEIPIAQGFNRDHGVVEIIWLNTDNTVRSIPLSPAPYLAGLNPVRFNESTEDWVMVNASNPGNQWYEYIAQVGGIENGRTSRWANARDVNHNMFVWVPRYAYRIIYFDSNDNANLRRDNPASTQRTNRIQYCSWYNRCKRRNT